MSGPEPIAIVGMACVFPGAPDLARYWANIRDGVDAIGDVPATHWSTAEHYDPDPRAIDRTYGRRGGFLAAIDVDPRLVGVSPRDFEATDTTQILGLVAAKQALEDAGYFEGGRALDRARTSVVLGVTGALELVVPLGARLQHPLWRRAMRDAGVDAATADDVVARIGEGLVEWREASFPGLLGNVAAGRIANRLDLHGTNCVVDAACASSLAALHLAVMELRAGRADIVIGGGADTFSDVFMYTCFSKTPALSPTQDARPFAEDGDGTILGEGVGMLVLERESDARRKGHRVYALIRAIGSSSDGGGQAIYAPSSAGQARAIASAYAEAGVTPRSIELIEAHGTGTKVGDATEIGGLAQVFGAAAAAASESPEPNEARSGFAPWCALGSVKSMIGHTKAAAGAAGVIKAALALHHRTIPPTLKVACGNRALSQAPALYIPSRARPWPRLGGTPRRAGVSAFGFGGSNYHAVLEEAPAALASDTQRTDWSGACQILPLFGTDLAALQRELDALERAVDGEERRDGAESRAHAPFLAQASAHARWMRLRAAGQALRARFDARTVTPDEVRMVLVVRGVGDLDAAFADARAAHRPHRAAGHLVVRGQGEARGSLVWVCPGQGSQYVGMGRELAQRFGEAARARSFVDSALELALREIAEAIEPMTDGAIVGGQPTDEASVASDARSAAPASDPDAWLRATQRAQPAIGVCALAAHRVLSRFGVKADAAIGHSYGELVALTVMGRIRERDLLGLSIARGRAMAQAAEASGDAGTMSAFFSSREEVAAWLGDRFAGVVIANDNSDEQVVIAGPTAGIESAERAWQGEGRRCARLPVSAAFHSAIVGGAAKAMASALEAVDVAPGDGVVIGNVRAEPLPAAPHAVKELLATQIVSPVRFREGIEHLLALGAATFIELGPDAKIRGLVERTAARWLTSHGRAASHATPDTTMGARIHPETFDGDAAVAVISVDAHRGRRGGLFDLAEALARVASRGHTVRLSQWDPDLDGALARELARPRPAISIAVTGANAKPARTPRPPRPVATPLPSANAAHEHATSQYAAPPVAAMSSDARTPQPSSAATPHAGERAGDSPQVAGPAADPALLAAGLDALVRLQAETADLHRRFLEHQAETTRALTALLTGQSIDTRIAVGRAAPELAHAGEPSSQRHADAAWPHATSAAITPQGQAAPYAADAASRPHALAPASVGERPAPASSRLEPAPRQAAVAAPAASIASPRAASTGTKQDHAALGEMLFAIVADKTGYPVEMLDASLGLDADLGIDSIKRVEILSALQVARPELPALEPSRLGELRTLGDIVTALQPDGEEPAAGAVDATAAQSTVSPPTLGATQIPTPSHAAGSATAMARGPSSAALSDALLAIVADKTGYPLAMLDLSMGLDADLGIDSIKRVEILSALQTSIPTLPSLSSDRLGALRTLGDIVAALSAHAPDAAPPTVPPASAPRQDVTPAVPATHPRAPSDARSMSAAFATAHDHVAANALPAVSPPEGTSAGSGGETTPDPSPASLASRADALARWLPVWRSFPLAGAEPALSLAGRSVWLVGGSDVADLLADRLHDAGCGVMQLGLSTACERMAEAEPPSGLIFVDVGDDEGVATAFEIVRRAAPALAARSEGLLAVITHEDTETRRARSAHEDDAAAAHVAVPRALGGLIKSAALEWPHVHARSIAIATGTEVAEVVDAIVHALVCHGPVELGLRAEGPVELALQPAPIAASTLDPICLGDDDVVLCTGGARGITAAIALALASRGARRFALVGRTEPIELPGGFPQDTDESGARRWVALHEGVTSPRALAERARSLRASAEIAATLSALRDLGARAEYWACDVSDAASVGATTPDIAQRLGMPTLLVHGAGVLRDRLLVDKRAEDLAAVYGAKVTGLRNLLTHLDLTRLRRVLVTASSTGRFGRQGQSDYAVANEGLVDLAGGLRHRGIVTVACDFGPWAGGMVDADLTKAFAREGITLIPLTGGAAHVVDELLAATPPCEVVLLGPGSRLPPILVSAGTGIGEVSDRGAAANPGARAAARPSAGGEVRGDRATPARASSLAHHGGDGDAGGLAPDSARPASAGGSRSARVAFERELSIETHPVLADHVVGGAAVLPTALACEWLAHAVSLAHPGMEVAGLDQLRVARGIRLGDTDRLKLRVELAVPTRAGDETLVEAALCSGPANAPARHFMATVRLGVRAPISEIAQGQAGPANGHRTGHEASHRRASASPIPAEYSVIEQAYETLLFHGPSMQGLREIERLDPDGLCVRGHSAARPSQWLASPHRARWLIDPLLIDCGLQAVVLWTQRHRGVPSLPTRWQSLSLHQAWSGGAFAIHAEITAQEGAEVVADLHWLDVQGHPIATMRGYRCICDESLRSAYARRELASGADDDANYAAK